MEAKTVNESRNSLVVGNLWDLEAHIREASDVVVQGFVFPVPYPLKIIFISRLLAGSDEVVDECLPEFLPRVKRVFEQAKKPLVTSLVEDDREVVCHDMLVPYC